MGGMRKDCVGREGACDQRDRTSLAGVILVSAVYGGITINSPGGRGAWD